jgi:DNA polymerase-3 subunit epsilon/CBS domain-containing protein
MRIFSAARVIALANGIPARSTRERLETAAEMKAAPKEIVSDLLEAHRIFLQLVLRQQLRDIAAGMKLSNAVAPSELSGFEREELDWALHRVPAVSNLLGTPAV